jgi:hypothetical protein
MLKPMIFYRRDLYMPDSCKNVTAGQPGHRLRKSSVRHYQKRTFYRGETCLDKPDKMQMSGFVRATFIAGRTGHSP